MTKEEEKYMNGCYMAEIKTNVIDAKPMTAKAFIIGFEKALNMRIVKQQFMEKYKKVIEVIELKMLENRKRVIELVKRYKNGDKTISIVIKRKENKSH